MNIDQLQQLYDSGIINMKALCEKAELNYNTIFAKIRRGTELTKFESFTLKETLSETLKPFIQ